MIVTYDARIQRAQHLKTIHTFAAEILEFYERICAAQSGIHTRLMKALRSSRPPVAAELREHMNVDLVVPCASEVLKEIVPVSPDPLKAFVAEYLQGSQERLAVSLQAYVDYGGTDRPPADSGKSCWREFCLNHTRSCLASRSLSCLRESAGTCARAATEGLSWECYAWKATAPSAF